MFLWRVGLGQAVQPISYTRVRVDPKLLISMGAGRCFNLGGGGHLEFVLITLNILTTYTVHEQTYSQ